MARVLRANLLGTEAAEARAKGLYTRELADYCTTLHSEDIPPKVRERAKYIILDGLGCSLYGARLPWSVLLTRSIARLSGAGVSPVWGTTLTLPPDHAALVNGSYVQAFELDDYHPDGALHSCANVLPAVLASLDLAEGATGADVLAAIVAGFEVGIRVGQCLNASRVLERGWHSGAVFGTHAAAAAAGRVLGLSADQLCHAFGIAGTQSSGLMSAQFGSMVKRMHHGRAAQSGLYAAVLARDGYTGIGRIFEERYGGFCTTFTATEDGFELDRLVDGLGQRFETERIAIKPYACNGSVHTSLDAIRAIRTRRPFEPEDVKQVTVRCTRSTLEHIGWPYEPTSMTAAQMNLSFGIAVMIERSDAFVEQYTEESIHSPSLIALTRRVRVVHEPAFDALGPRHRHHIELTLDFTDGGSERETVDAALGSPTHPLPNSYIGAKYDRLARPVLGNERADALKAVVLDLDRVSDPARIASFLQPDASS